MANGLTKHISDQVLFYFQLLLGVLDIMELIIVYKLISTSILFVSFFVSFVMVGGVHRINTTF